MREDEHILLQFTFLSARCAVRHKSDLNLNTLCAFCLYQRGQPNHEGAIWDGDGERATLCGSLPWKSSHIQGPAARSGQLIIVGSQPDHQGRSLIQRHWETDMLRKTQLERQGWLHTHRAIWLDIVYLLLKTQSSPWEGLRLSQLCSVLQGAWHRLGVYRTCWQKAPALFNFTSFLGLLKQTWAPSWFQGQKFLCSFSKSGVSSFSISLFSHCLLFGWARVWTDSRFHFILVIAGT